MNFLEKWQEAPNFCVCGEFDQLFALLSVSVNGAQAVLDRPHVLL